METRDCGPRMREFLGGWRNKLTGLEYLNARTQTEVTEKRDRIDVITQTFRHVGSSTDDTDDKAVQVSHFVPDVGDKLLESVSRPDRTIATEMPTIKTPESLLTNERFIDAAVRIQRFYRSYRTRVNRRAASTRDALDVPQNAILTRVILPNHEGDFAILNHRSPKTRADFELLHNLLDRWRILELEEARRAYFEPSRLAMGTLILSKEVEFLRRIDTLKTSIRSRRRDQRDRKFLDELSRGVIWKDKHGEPINVDTERAQLARDHRSTYVLLSKEDTSVTERIDFLRTLKRTLLFHTCRESKDLIDLIDQEIEFLLRDTDPRKLNWLRRRLGSSFLRLARNSLRDDQRHPDVLLASLSTKLCRTCGRLLSLDEFPRDRRSAPSSCNRCVSLRVKRDPRVVYEPYERLLRELRHLETRKGCHGGLAFTVGPEVVYHLVNSVWHGRSGISECDDLEQLRLVRFHRDIEWTPWNTLLLTKEEASAHLSVKSLDNFYGAMLLQRFRTKNLLAKLHFRSIVQSSRDLSLRTDKLE